MKHPLWSKASLAALALLLAALVGCSADEQVNPAPIPASAADAGPGAPEPPAASIGPWKRSLLLRSPFGGPSGNLLADGDVELSTLDWSGAQVGFRAFTNDGSSAIPVKTETGGLCRTGLRCAVVEPKTLQLLRGTAARDKGNIASIWAKLPAGAVCKAVRVVLIQLDDFIPYTTLKSEKSPDEDGYCHYTTRIAEKTSAIGLYVENTLPKGTFALLDSAVIAPDDGTIYPKAAELWAPPADLMERLGAVRETIQKTAPPPRRAPGPVPP